MHSPNFGKIAIKLAIALAVLPLWACAAVGPSPVSPSVAVDNPLDLALAPVDEVLKPGAAAVAPESNGFVLAGILMVGMLLALAYAGVAVARAFLAEAEPVAPPAWLTLAIPVLSLLGLGVAGYLTYIETNSVVAICGPIGDCNSVQSSPYARVLGFLPVGVLGLGGYLAILLVWLYGRYRRDRLASYAPLVLFGLALFGTLFSIYLTYIELFVIHAVCLWCLSSALIITLQMVFSIPGLLQALNIPEED
jgi:uncharacterized membrane protein